MASFNNRNVNAGKLLWYRINKTIQDSFWGQ